MFGQKSANFLKFWKGILGYEMCVHMCAYMENTERKKLTIRKSVGQRLDQMPYTDQGEDQLLDGSHGDLRLRELLLRMDFERAKSKYTQTFSF